MKQLCPKRKSSLFQNVAKVPLSRGFSFCESG